MRRIFLCVRECLRNVFSLYETMCTFYSIRSGPTNIQPYDRQQRQQQLVIGYIQPKLALNQWATHIAEQPAIHYHICRISSLFVRTLSFSFFPSFFHLISYLSFYLLLSANDDIEKDHVWLFLRKFAIYLNLMPSPNFWWTSELNKWFFVDIHIYFGNGKCTSVFVCTLAWLKNGFLQTNAISISQHLKHAYEFSLFVFFHLQAKFRWKKWLKWLDLQVTSDSSIYYLFIRLK